jgi:aspartyl-tRNA(Asn)/glutamyl-tRNA(Gln) amidotransferase subunit A
LQKLPFDEIRQQLSTGEVSMVQLVEAYIKQIKATNQEINAVVFYDEQDAFAQAKRIQEKISQGTAGPLAGAIVGIKELICQEGVQATCASNILKDFKSTYDATVIKKLKAADALLLGRLNMDEFAMGSSTEYSIFGATKNPVDTTRVSGGSSGGSAAAVAANYCTMSLGSDTGGSIRQPASYCGVVGLKPSYGRVSRYGLIAYASSFDCIGPFSRNVADSARMLSVLAGKDEHDMTTSSVDVDDYMAALKEDVKGLRIGIYEGFFSDGLDPEVASSVKDMIARLESKGAVIVPIKLDTIKYGISVYYILATAEASSNLARFDGIRYGHRADIKQIKLDLSAEKEKLEAIIKSEISEPAEQKKAIAEAHKKVDNNLNRLYKQSRTEGFGDEVKRRIMLGTYVLSSGYYDAYYAKAQKIRRLIKEDFERAYENVDVIASPTAPTTAFKLGDNHDDPIQMYLNDIYTITANLTGNCGISIPCGSHSNGLPIGIQFTANAYNERALFRAAQAVENEYQSK